MTDPDPPTICDCCYRRLTARERKLYFDRCESCEDALVDDLVLPARAAMIDYMMTTVH